MVYFDIMVPERRPLDRRCKTLVLPSDTPTTDHSAAHKTRRKSCTGARYPVFPNMLVVFRF